MIKTRNLIGIKNINKLVNNDYPLNFVKNEIVIYQLDSILNMICPYLEIKNIESSSIWTDDIIYYHFSFVDTDLTLTFVLSGEKLGNVSSIYIMKNDKYHSPSQYDPSILRFYESGSVQEILFHKNGKLHNENNAAYIRYFPQEINLYDNTKINAIIKTIIPIPIKKEWFVNDIKINEEFSKIENNIILLLN